MDRASRVTRIELLRFLAERRRDPLKALERIHRAHPGIARLDTASGAFFLIVEPSHLRHVLIDNARNYSKEALRNRFEPVAGRGLFTNDGPTWIKQRKIVSPAFHRDRLAHFSAVMAERSAVVADAWAKRAAGKGEPVDMAQEMIDLTLDIVLRTLLGTDAERYHDTLRTSFATMIAGIEERSFADRVVDLVPFVRRSPRLRAAVQALPLPANVELRRAIEALDAIVFRIIEEKRRAMEAGAPPEKDVVSVLLRARHEDGSAMTDKQLRDEVVIVFLAGHETSASALSWAFVSLAKHPEVDRRAAAEMRAVLGEGEATQAGVAKLEYSARVYDEVLRLYPSAWRLSRTAIADDVIDGCAIPAGSTLLFVPYFTHRLASHWDDPEAFDPDRFLPERVAVRDRLAYFPFGAGPRACIGEAFARVEAMIILSTILRRVRLELVPGQKIEFDPRLSLRSKHPLWMRPILRP